MRSGNAPRYQGKITSWKDEQGFGFITPNGGGPAVFVHISAFVGRAVRPAGGDIVTYHLGANDKGPRAEQVARVRSRPATKTSSSRTQHGASKTRAWIAALGFLGLVALCVVTGKLPAAVLMFYCGASAVAYAAYAIDKSRARKNAWRTKENTLHVLGLLGGWPGALVARQVLRHKTNKASFRGVFRATVLINCGCLAWYVLSQAST